MLDIFRPSDFRVHSPAGRENPGCPNRWRCRRRSGRRIREASSIHRRAVVTAASADRWESLVTFVDQGSCPRRAAFERGGIRSVSRPFASGQFATYDVIRYDAAPIADAFRDRCHRRGRRRNRRLAHAPLVQRGYHRSRFMTCACSTARSSTRSSATAYLLSLQPDRMLHNFRVNAGLEPKAPVYGGWESEEPWVEIRCHGHTLGHYLTAASLMYASTGDQRMKQRVDYIVAELQACQTAARRRARVRVPRRRGAARECRRRPAVHRRAVVHDAQGLRRPARCARPRRAAPRRSTSLTSSRTGRPPRRADERRAVRSACCDTEHGGMNEVLADVCGAHRRARSTSRSRAASATRRCSRRSPKDATRSTACTRTRRSRKSSASSGCSS